MADFRQMQELDEQQQIIRWRILNQMKENARFGDFTDQEIQETELAFGLKETNHANG